MYECFKKGQSPQTRKDGEGEREQAVNHLQQTPQPEESTTQVICLLLKL